MSNVRPIKPVQGGSEDHRNCRNPGRAPRSAARAVLAPTRPMTSLKQIAANRLNARKSTGPRTERGKQRSRQNALRHGLTAETVISVLEDAADYQALEASIMADHQPHSATDRELVCRLVSVLWRLRRATSIANGLFQAQGELVRQQNARAPRRRRPVPPSCVGFVPLLTAKALDRI